eukprot:353237-Chlamydomonas_euryale.AAC.1
MASQVRMALARTAHWSKWDRSEGSTWPANGPLPACLPVAPYQHACQWPLTSMPANDPVPACLPTTPYQHACQRPRNSMPANDPLPACLPTTPYQHACQRP